MQCISSMFLSHDELAGIIIVLGTWFLNWATNLALDSESCSDSCPQPKKHISY